MRPFMPVVLFLALGCSLAAQPNPGDFIVGDYGRTTSHGGVFAIDPVTGKRTTLVNTLMPGYYTNWITMDLDNRNMMAVSAGNIDIVFRVSPTGGVTTVAAPFGYLDLMGITLDEDGTYLVTPDTGAGDPILRVTGSSVSTVTTTSHNILNGICVDPATGHYVMPVWGTGLVINVDRNTLAVTTIGKMPAPVTRITSVDYHPWSGDFLVTSFGGYNDPMNVYKMDRGGSTTIFIALQTLQKNFFDHAVKVDDQTGDIYVAGSGGIGVYPPGGGSTPTKTFGPLGFSWTSLEVYGSRNVVGQGSGRAGTAYTFDLSFPLQKSAPYIAALSLSGLQPGILLPNGRTVHLIPDPLAVLMITHGDIQGITSGFVGTLNSQGNARAIVNIPPGFPPGIRLYIGVLVMPGAGISSWEVGNPCAFTTKK